jgi:hypothetical protein
MLVITYQVAWCYNAEDRDKILHHQENHVCDAYIYVFMYGTEWHLVLLNVLLVQRYRLNMPRNGYDGKLI